MYNYIHNHISCQSPKSSSTSIISYRVTFMQHINWVQNTDCTNNRQSYTCQLLLWLTLNLPNLCISVYTYHTDRGVAPARAYVCVCRMRIMWMCRRIMCPYVVCHVQMWGKMWHFDCIICRWRLLCYQSPCQRHEMKHGFCKTWTCCCGGAYPIGYESPSLSSPMSD